MELSDLAVFRTVAETGGVSKAASVLHRVPSNVTARIQKLEAELDKQLFIRENNRLRISPDGEHLLAYARQILSLADEAVAKLNDDVPSGTLRIGSMEAVAASRLSKILMRYHKTYQDVKLEVSTNPTGELIEQVLAGTLDLALVADPAPDSRLDALPVFREKLVLVSGSQQAPIQQPSDLGVYPTLLGFSPKCAYRTTLTTWVKQANMQANVVEINSYHALLNCVTAGMGVGIVPEVLLETYPFRDGILTHPLPDSLQWTTTCAIWRRDSLKPSLSAFNELLSEASNLDA